jgi:hypothetical protein
MSWAAVERESSRLLLSLKRCAVTAMQPDMISDGLHHCVTPKRKESLSQN